MEGQNRGAESQNSDRGQPIGDESKPVGGPVDVAVAVAAVADGGVKTELGCGGGGCQVARRKRGRPPKAQAKQPPAKKNKEEVEEEEDVCFICFDGGSLVLCDRRGCPKAYHPACIKRDEAFFQSAAKWNCGWHICSICQKSAHHMCYTCTYSLCKGCIRKADYVCVRGDKGFCTICMKTIMLIENNGQGEDGKVQVDFDDKTSWEYLFKVYWVYLKGKLSLTLDELTQAKNPWKGASTISSVYPSTGINLEANESKRRKTGDQIDVLHKGTVNMEKLGNDGSCTTTVEGEAWATKELLDFIAHMKNGDTSVLSESDVQALMMEYVKRNNLWDPRKKGQIICDSRLKTLFGKSRVGHLEMLNHLEYHCFIKKDPQKSTINTTAVQVDAEKNPRNRSKTEERALQNKLDEYAAIDVHNMNLIYLRRNLMENLFEDTENFHGKVVGSIVRIKILGSDLKHDMYRLVQVVGTSKVDVPYKIGSKLVDVMLEVLNLDKKETVSIDTTSDQEISEEECRRLQQSIRCGLVKHFTVGEIQDKAMALQSVRLNDWMETETLRLNHLRDVASGKGHKKGYRECVEKLQLLRTPEELERRLQEIPEVHSDPKMNPNYESDDTEEYFNKEHGEHMESKYYRVSSKNACSPKKQPESSNEQPVMTYLCIEDGSTKATGKDTLGLSLGVDCDDSTITKWNNQTTISSSLSNNTPETVASSIPSNDGEIDMVWHYRDPNGKVQGPFSLVQLERWSTTGYFPLDMRVWPNREDKSILLNDVLKERFHNYDARWSENTTDANKVLAVCSSIPSSTIAAPSNCGDHEKLANTHGSLGQSFGQNWSANNLDYKPPSIASLTMSNESTVRFNASNLPDSKDAGADFVELPNPALNGREDEKVQSVPPTEVLIQDSGNPPSWSSASSLVVSGAKLPVSADGWGGCSSTLVKREEWDSGIVLKPLEMATPTSNIEQNIQSSSQPELPSWHGVGEMIEFSTLAEESVSDLLAEVDAMESQYGLPSPTSRRNSFVDDLFNGSFDDEFSPTPDQGTRSDGFSSSGDIQLQQHSFIGPEIDGGIPPRTNSGFKWPQVERVPQVMIDINRSAKAETDDGDVQPVVPPDEDGKFIQLEAPPSLPPPPPLTLGLDPFDPHGKIDHSGQGRSGYVGWDPNPNQHRHGGERYNTSSSSSSGRTSFGGSGGYSRPPSKGQRVCKFYESGRCKKGASCKHLHP